MSRTVNRTASPTADRVSRAAGHPVAVVCRGLLRGHWSVGRWAFPVIAVAATLVIVVWAAIGTPTTSIVGFSRQGMMWFPFSLSIAIAVGQVNVHVAMGRTRRTLGRAAVLAALVMSVVYAVGLVVLMQVERGVYAVAGWQHVIVDQLTFVSDTSQVGLLVGEYLVTTATAQLSGLLCGITYYRFGGWVGTLSLPLTVGPVLLVLAGVSADVPFLSGDLAVGTVGGGALRAVVVVVVLAAVVVAFQRILRSTPVRTAALI